MPGAYVIVDKRANAADHDMEVSEVEESVLLCHGCSETMHYERPWRPESITTFQVSFDDIAHLLEFRVRWGCEVWV